jgi:hypothetical protein
MNEASASDTGPHVPISMEWKDTCCSGPPASGSWAVIRGYHDQKLGVPASGECEEEELYGSL